MSQHFLEKDETIILEDGKGKTSAFGLEQTLILTTKRVLILRETHTHQEIPLDSVVEAYNDVDSFTGISQLVLLLNDGRKISHQFTLSSEITLEGQPSALKLHQQAFTDGWVTAINSQKNLPKQR